MVSFGESVVQGLPLEVGVLVDDHVHLLDGESRMRARGLEEGGGGQLGDGCRFHGIIE